jgi:hypothetical protein
LSQPVSAPDKNPLEMKPLAEGGPFVLASMPCSQRRREYFQRANRIIATYATVTAYSAQGQKAIEAGAAAGKVGDSTPIRIVLGDHAFQTNYKMVRSAFAKAGAQLTNLVFLLLYGNFEAFLADLACDALSTLGTAEPFEEAVTLVAMTKWKGKLDRIAQKFSLPLGHKRYVAAYAGIDMQFLGKTTEDPVEFLQATADLRHRLVHAAGRADAHLLAEYPQSGLTEGVLIELPFGLPVGLHFWFVPLTDLLDEAFSTTFGWTRETTAIDQLIDADLRIV